MATYESVGIFSATAGANVTQVTTNIDTAFQQYGVQIGNTSTATMQLSAPAPHVWFHVNIASTNSFGPAGNQQVISILNTSGDILFGIRSSAGIPLTVEAYNVTANTVIGTLFQGTGLTPGMNFIIDVEITPGYFALYVDNVLQFTRSGLTQPGADINQCILRSASSTFTTSQSVFSEPIIGIGANSCTVGHRVTSRFPTANGTYTAWGTSGFANLDDGPITNDALRATSNTAGQRSSYTFPAYPGTAPGNIPIEMIGISSSALHDSTGVVDYRHFVRIGGVDYDQALLGPTAALAAYRTNLTVSPATGITWTAAEYNAMQIGILSA